MALLFQFNLTHNDGKRRLGQRTRLGGVADIDGMNSK